MRDQGFTKIRVGPHKRSHKQTRTRCKVRDPVIGNCQQTEIILRSNFHASNAKNRANFYKRICELRRRKKRLDNPKPIQANLEIHLLGICSGPFQR